MIKAKSEKGEMEGLYEKLAEGVEMPETAAEEKLTVLPMDQEYLPLNHPKYQGIAAAKGYAQGDDFSGNRLQKVRYSHEAMIDILIAEPEITQNELAQRFGKSRGWISIVMGSDAFQGALAKRRDDLMNPEIIASLEERYKGLADQSLQILSKKLDETQNPDLALKSLEVAGRALGFGARGTGGNTTNNTFVVALPPKIADSADWATAHAKNITPRQIESK
jgi:hypothetical protein